MSDFVSSPGPDDSAWIEFADVSLQRLALLHRLGRGQDPGDSAGLRLDDHEVDALLIEVSGSGNATAVKEASDRLQPALDGARERFRRSLADLDSPFAAVVHNARLTLTDAEVLAIAVACEIDVRRQRLVGYLQDDVQASRLNLQTVARLLGGFDCCANALGPDARLRRAGLVEVVQEGPWAQHSIVVPTSLVWAFVGDGAADPDLPHGAITETIDEADGDRLVTVTGPDLIRRRNAAVRATAGDTFLVTPAPSDDRGWAAIVREATMIGSGVVVELAGALSTEGRRWIEHADHLAWAISSRAELPIGELPDRPWVELEVPGTELTRAEWAEAFGEDTPHVHRLTAQQVTHVRRAFVARGGDIDGAVRRLLAGPLESLARRIRPRHTWDDIILSPDRLEQLRAIVARYRHAGQVYDNWAFPAVPSRGMVALFSGASGTGKTLAAEILAGELGLDMFKLELSTVVSKYIGETEKNLDQVFDAAGVGNVVLFFDEADSLFGKRSEVKDARDRYANIEVSYLLQRIEAYDGVVVLATNFEKNIDDAFMRRIHSRIEFVVPGEDERVAIWRRHLPAEAPLGDIDLKWLACQFELAGGQIRNAAVHAAFLAADAATPITMPCLVRGVAHELRKSGRLLKPADFGEWFASLAD